MTYLLKRQRGMTLMELLTVVVVIGILASIAIPSYRRYLMRAQRSDATTTLLRLATAQEKHYLQYGTYVTTASALGNSHASGGVGVPTTSERGFYTLSITDNGGLGYLATATPVAGGGQATDTTCASFTITESGTKRAYNSASADKTSECFR